VFIIIVIIRAISDPSVRLMFVGLSGRGKSSLLCHLRWAGSVATIPVGWRDRMDQEHYGKNCYALLYHLFRLAHEKHI